MNIIKIEVTQNQANLITRNGVTKDGKNYSINEQKAYIHLGGDYPTEFTMALHQNQPPYSAGFYYLHASSFQVGSFGKLEVKRDIVLIPINDANKK